MVNDNAGKNTITIAGPKVGPSAYVVNGSYDIINVNTSAGPVEMILPNIIRSGFDYNNKKFYVNDVGGVAGTNNITILGADNQINGGTSAVISKNNGSVECVQSSKTEWLVVGDGIASASPANNLLTVASGTIQMGGVAIKNTSLNIDTYDFDIVAGPDTIARFQQRLFSAPGANDKIWSFENASGSFGVSVSGVEPEGTITGNPMDLVLSAYSGIGSLYIKATGTGNTGWAQLLTASPTPVPEFPPVISQINPPPGAPSLGDRYLIGTAPTGVWAGKANQIAEWNGASWDYTIPSAGDTVYVTNTLTTKRFNGTAWVNYPGTAVLINGNTTTAHMPIGTNNGFNLQFKTTNVIRAQISSSGLFYVANNTMIGDISMTPTARLHVRGADSGAVNFTFKADNSAGDVGLAVRNDGRVGLGTATPGAKLDVQLNTLGLGNKVVRFSVNNGTDEVFSINDVLIADFTGQVFNVRGSNGFINLISNGGINPQIDFTYNNGADVAGRLYGNAASFAIMSPSIAITGVEVGYFNPTGTMLYVRGRTNDNTQAAGRYTRLDQTDICVFRNDYSIIANASGYFYFGDPDTNDSIRLFRDTSTTPTSITAERRDAGVWIPLFQFN